MEGVVQKTVFLIPNLHCPSCVAQIEVSLASLGLGPRSISYSIISHSITVRHPPTLTVQTMSNALDKAGFEVFGVAAEGDESHADTRSTPHGSLASPFQQALNRWRSNGPTTREDQNRKRKRHFEYCEECRLKSSAPDNEKSVLDSAPPTTTAASPFVAVDDLDTSTTSIFQATLSIEGMSCSSCVGNISKSLEEKPWVHSVTVSLLTNSATVDFTGENHKDDLIDIISNVGYDASIESIIENLTPKAATSNTQSLWQASFSVDGMTCSSCVGNVTKAIEALSWVKKVDVNLLTNHAVVVLEGKDHLEGIISTIEDVGYSATLQDVLDLAHEQTTSKTRTVLIHIGDIYCEHCGPRIEKALKGFNTLNIEQVPTVANPILKISYVPSAPNFTIRHILHAISEADPAFKASIHHPMSVEERSRIMHRREKWQILYRVILSVLAAIPTLIIGIIYMNLVSQDDPNRRYLMTRAGGVTRAEWAMFVMATPVYLFAADVFHRRTIKELRALWRPGNPTPIIRRFYRFGSMNMLISFGTTIAYFSSIAELAIAATQNDESQAASPSYFDSVVFLTMFLLLDRLIEAYSKAKTGDAVAALGKLRPTEAMLVVREGEGGGDSQTAIHRITLDDLEFGDVVRVLHGGSPPCDGIILEGESKFDESSLTGESRLVPKSVGDEVFAGTVNKGSPISVKVNGVSGTSMLDQIMQVVREGQARRAPVERVADIITSYFVPIITLIAVSTWVIWLSLGLAGVLPNSWLDIGVGGWPFWSLQFAIAVFIIACPCGIGLAAPTALFVGGGLAARNGILVKGGGEAFQEASGLDCVVFDKTGTLTEGGEPLITDSEIFPQTEGQPLDERTILAIVERLEADSTHPIAKAAVVFCKTRDIGKIRVKAVEEIPGKGLKGSFISDSMENYVIEAIFGNESLLADHEVTISDKMMETLDSWKKQGKSVAILATKAVADAQPADLTSAWIVSAIFAASDPLRSEAIHVVDALQKRGVRVWMISGDSPITAYAVGEKVGIPKENIIAGVLPEQKAEKINYLQKSMKKMKSNVFGHIHETQDRAIVAMVGDGINDSPALTMADVGIAIGSGSDVAISSAEFVLVSSNLYSLLTLIDLSRAVFRRVKFNFAWALIYNLVALPIAAGVLYPVVSNGSHIRLDPVWASLAMALSSLSVISSSLLLRTKIPVIGFRAQKRAE